MIAGDPNRPPVISTLPGEHEGPVNGLALARDAERDVLFSVADDGSVIGRDLRSGDITHWRADAHGDAIGAICTCDCGPVPLLITGGRDGFVRIWRRNPDLDMLASISLDAPITSLAAVGSKVLVGATAGIAAIDVERLASLGR
jgi:WD40 repeat protein